MKWTKRVVFAITCACMLVSLQSCAAYKVEDLIEPTEKLIQTITNETDYLYLNFETPIAEQLRTAEKPKVEKDQPFTYTLVAYTADIDQLPVEKLSIDPPDYDLNAPDAEAFCTTFSTAAAESIKAYLSDEKNIFTVAQEIVVTYTKNENKTWTPSLDSNSINGLATQTQRAVTDLSTKLAEENTAYESLLLADKLQKALYESIPDAPFYDAFKIDGIEKTGNDFSVSLTYPDPTPVYTQASNASYDRYAQAGKVLFQEITDEAVMKSITTDLTLTEGSDNAIQKTLLFPEDGSQDALDQMLQEINDIRNSTITSLRERVNSEFVNPVQDPPASGVLSGENSGQSLTIDNTAELGDVHVTFYKLSGTDLTEDGVKALSVYIKAGDSTTVYLPIGNYKMIQGIGTTWYGSDLAFGPYGFYQLSNTLVQIEANYYYTLSLYGSEDGNLPTVSIPYPYG